MPNPILEGKRVLVTQADAFMGPALYEVLAEQGVAVWAETLTLEERARSTSSSTASMP